MVNGRSLIVTVFSIFIIAAIFETKSPSASPLAFVFTIVPWALLCVIVILGFIETKRNAKLYAENNDAIALLDSGRFAEAELMFCKLNEKFKNNWIVKHNLALTLIRQGKFERAAHLLKDFSQLKQQELSKSFMFSTEAHLHALSSNLEEAEIACYKARNTISTARSGLLAVANSVIAIRHGVFKQVAEVTDDEWFAAEMVAGGQMRLMRILRAFALSKVPPTEQSQALMQQMLAGARPFRPSEYDFLATRIPELKMFLIEHGFSQPQAAPGVQGAKV